MGDDGVVLTLVFIISLSLLCLPTHLGWNGEVFFTSCVPKLAVTVTVLSSSKCCHFKVETEKFS